MSCQFVGTEGLQKEFGHDRVRFEHPPCCTPRGFVACAGADGALPHSLLWHRRTSCLI